MLTHANLNVYATDLGEEGIDLAKLYDYDLILLDLDLPERRIVLSDEGEVTSIAMSSDLHQRLAAHGQQHLLRWLDQLDKQAQAQLIEQIEEVDVERLDEETLRISFDSDILFAVDSAVLSDASKNSLDEFARVMRDYPQTAILVQGYTDSTGSETYNMQLSERRAKAVFNHLALREVDTARMAAIGYGEGYPVADNATPEGRALNRRVEILVKGKA